MEQAVSPFLRQLLRQMLDAGASDLHLTTGTPPQMRVDGRLNPVSHPPLGPAQTRELCYSLLSDEQRARFEAEQELDFAFGLQGLARFRVNMYMQRGAVAGAFRTIPAAIPTMEDLGLPAVVSEMARRPQGLILVTGPTGSGKSTTMAAIIDRINTERQCHILTVEDPIEFVHPHRRSIVNQRELGLDTFSYTRALKYVLRQDPDVVLIGEIRDRETVEAVLSISETGHLVLATLHTGSAVQTINRVVDMFPQDQQTQVRAQFCQVLVGIVSQRLIPRQNGRGRVLAAEVLVGNPAVRNLIREEKVHLIYNQMQLGQARNGMQTLNQALATQVLRGHIAVDQALMAANEPDELRTLLSSGMKITER